MKKLFGAMCVLSAVVFSGCDSEDTPAILTEVKATFDDGAEGWTIVGNGTETPVAAQFIATGGNPDGRIFGKDDQGAFGDTWYFSAPADFLGDKSGAYGKRLKFDLRVDSTDLTPPDERDIVLKSGSVELTYDITNNPSASWTAYNVPLTETGWKKGDAAATKADVEAALNNVTALLIRGEFKVGEDESSLDNVLFATGD